MTDLHAYTGEELEQELARVLAHARGEVLNDAEMQIFWQLNEQLLAALCWYLGKCLVLTGRPVH